MQTDSDETGSVTLHLLDAAQGHPIQTWHFSECRKIKIGRASDNHISLTDTQVSRLHVELVYDDGRWTLISLGRNGTRIDGSPVSEVRLLDRTIFQLGKSGPSFQLVTVNDSVSGMQTIENIDPSALDFLVIDEQRKAEEVQQIAESEAFEQLRQQARRLKQGKGDQ